MSQGGKQKFNKPIPLRLHDAIDQGPVLLVHEDGSIEQQESFTDDLYNGIEAGVVDVIRLVDGKFQYYTTDGTWVEV